jgi:hypothetical protein
MDEDSASYRVKFASNGHSRRFGLFYLWLNQPPNFGCALQLESFKLTTSKAAAPTLGLSAA